MTVKEVFVVYGRIYWSEAVFDHDDNYFGESTIFGVFETFESALTEFKSCVKEAHQYFAECAPWGLDEELVAKAAGANPFDNYNMLKDEFDEGDIQWSYIEETDAAEWQMYPVNVDTSFFGCPILAGIYIEKQVIKS